MSRFEIPMRRHCTSGFPPYCRSSRLKTCPARNVCKQACPSWSYDRHMSIMFDSSSYSWAPFAGERRFSKSRGLSARVSFLPLPHPLFLILALAPISRGQNTVPWSFFVPQPHGNAYYAGKQKEPGLKEILAFNFLTTWLALAAQLIPGLPIGTCRPEFEKFHYLSSERSGPGTADCNCDC